MSIFTINKQSKTTNTIVASEVIDKIKRETTPKEFDAFYEIHNRDHIFELDQEDGRLTHALLQAVWVKNYALINYITALGGKDLLDLSSDLLSPIRYAVYNRRLLKTLIVLGVNVNGLAYDRRSLKTLIALGVNVNCLAQKEDAFSCSSPLIDARSNLQRAQLLRGYGAQLTRSEMENSQQLISFILEWDETHKREKEPVKNLLNATLDDPRFQEVNKIIMEYVVPPSQEINYISIPRNVSGPLKEIIDEILPSHISEIIADYTQKSWVEISVID